jgi:endo-1,4-beta-xylanase
MHFSTIVASALAFTSTAVAVPTHPSHGKSDSLYKAIRSRGRGYVGTAWTIRDNETAEFDIIKQDFNS